MFLCSLLLIGFLLGWAVAREYSSRLTAQQILQAQQRCEVVEAAAREREWKLIDSYLRKQSVSPLVEREQVLKLSDPEATKPSNFVDEAFRLDQIKEIVETMNPAAAWESVEEARAQWPDLWKQAEAQFAVEQTPLRV